MYHTNNPYYDYEIAKRVLMFSVRNPVGQRMSDQAVKNLTSSGVYHTSGLPTFTYAGALMPKRDADKTMRKLLLIIAAVFCVAGLML